MNETRNQAAEPAIITVGELKSELAVTFLCPLHNREFRFHRLQNPSKDVIQIELNQSSSALMTGAGTQPSKADACGGGVLLYPMNTGEIPLASPAARPCPLPLKTLVKASRIDRLQMRALRSDRKIHFVSWSMRPAAVRLRLIQQFIGTSQPRHLDRGVHRSEHRDRPSAHVERCWCDALLVANDLPVILGSGGSGLLVSVVSPRRPADSGHRY
jgi:hypothetical protein